MRRLLFLTSVAFLASCSDNGNVNPPTEPAEPIETAEAGGAASPSAPGAPGAGTLPGTGPASFVGRWSADVSWCNAPTGDGRPIDITPDRFEGYENSCAITAVTQTDVGYEATLRCEGEGMTSTERVRMVVTGQQLTLTYLDRSSEPVTLLKCTTMGDTSRSSPAL